MNRKGNTGIVYFFGMLLIITMILFPGVLKADKNEAQYIIRSDDSYTIDDTLNIAKTQLYTIVFDISFYRSIDNFNDVYIASENVDEMKLRFEKKILDYLNYYTDNGRKKMTILGKAITLPEYKEVAIKTLGEKMSIDVKSDDKLSYDSSSMNANSFIHIEESADLTKIFKINIMDMRAKAEKIYDDIKSKKCSERKFDDICDKYHCKATHLDESGNCVTNIEVEYREEKYPVTDGTNNVFKYLSVTFIFGKTQSVTSNSPSQQTIDEKLGTWTKDTINSMLTEAQKISDVNERIVYIAKRFYDTPYKANTLIGSPSTEEILTVNFEGMDCVTFTDNVFALALSKDYNEFIDSLKKIRYQDNGATISYTTRNHYSTDALKENSEYFDVLTTSFQGYQSMPKTLNLLEGNGIPSHTITLNYIPKDKIADIADDLQSGDLIFFATRIDGLDVTHQGFIEKDGNNILFIHASSGKGKITKTPLVDYSKAMEGWQDKIGRNYIGIIFARSKMSIT